ncbi:2-oxoacid:ferredoxin oxidoreductase subunit beta [Candidatus Poribacteria bacterium]|nr:2-oxoacid:ferredoxin oxidoreductase subunit beta [Candidatus Poribacteria bacterium]
MVTMDDYQGKDATWCPGCGNFLILRALKMALVELDIAPHEILLVSGIGQAAKLPHYMKGNVINGLHGRTLSYATGAKIANHDLIVIATSGDGDLYGEGGNHFIHTIRRNPDITVIAHDNQVYGLTKGQASPTSGLGFVTRLQTDGVILSPFNPIALAISANASFVSRGFSGDINHLSKLIQTAIQHKGLALIDVLQPCVSFNRVNTFTWYRDRVYKLGDDYDPTNKIAAFQKSQEWGDKIPIGVIYTQDRPTFEEQLPALKEGPLFKIEVDYALLDNLLEEFI